MGGVGARGPQPLWEGGEIFRHGYTYSGHATSCAVALANLDIIERERLPQRVRELEPAFAAEVRRLAQHPLVQEVRTAGLLAGVQLRDDARAADPALLKRVVAAARGEGVLTRALMGEALQLSPPLVITEAEVRELVERLGAALDAVAHLAGAVAAP
jgi:adenosylmethionine-8-amino-7-oxononanoate aminotransferase